MPIAPFLMEQGVSVLPYRHKLQTHFSVRSGKRAKVRTIWEAIPYEGGLAVLAMKPTMPMNGAWLSCQIRKVGLG